MAARKGRVLVKEKETTVHITDRVQENLEMEIVHLGEVQPLENKNQLVADLLENRQQGEEQRKIRDRKEGSKKNYPSQKLLSIHLLIN